MKKQDWKFLAELTWRVICSAVFFSAVGYILSDSWWFWNWHWIGILIFWVLLIFVVLIAIEEETDKQIEEYKQQHNIK